VPEWKRLDHRELRRRLKGRCFICELLRGNPEFAHHVFYEDSEVVAFLNKYPVLYGYSLVAPREHREAVTGDFPLATYLDVQRVVYRVAEALRSLVATERLYIMSLGSQQANSHVHWHVAPLPSGTPFEQQQFAALDRSEYLDIPDAEMEGLAARLRAVLSATGA
jgi:diadenosine tetraphosphate (Ap4A) HIT family hydrolase